MIRRPHRIDTDLIHAGEPSPRIEGAVAMPVFQSATFAYAGEAAYGDVRYIRLSNTPNHLCLQAKLAVLEGGEAALVSASGMAAISSTLLSLLQNGEHVLAQAGLYGGSHDFISRELPRLGIGHTFVDAGDPDAFRRALRPGTRAVYVETLSNPLLRVGDLDGIVAFSREHGLVTVIDNTVATPLNFRPLQRGFDLSIHSCTKYLNGHSDIVAGAVIGRAELVQRVKHRLDHFGGSLDPHACVLLHRGLKTLALRVRHQNRSAFDIARFLSEHRGVQRVHYAGLLSHPDHERAQKLLSGYGGLLSFELAGGIDAAERFIARLTLPICAPSLGGIETLITRPATTSHAGLSPEERQQLGIGDALIRLSVGIEATEDLIEDLDRALLAG